MGYNHRAMYLTVAQTSIFQKAVSAIWSEQELDRFINWIALNPLAGDVIPGSGGLRKVRWSASSRGKRGGARVIYYNLLEDQTVWLLIIYTKARLDNLPANVLKELSNVIPKKNR